MKIRIIPNAIYERRRFFVQRKRWYGWETIYGADFIPPCIEYIEDLKKIANVELVKY